MWWEYAIITICLVAAAGYVVWTVRRAMSGRGSCASGGCDQTTRSDRAPKVTPLVQIRPPRK